MAEAQKPKMKRHRPKKKKKNFPVDEDVANDGFDSQSPPVPATESVNSLPTEPSYSESSQNPVNVYVATIDYSNSAKNGALSDHPPDVVVNKNRPHEVGETSQGADFANEPEEEEVEVNPEAQVEEAKVPARENVTPIFESYKTKQTEVGSAFGQSDNIPSEPITGLAIASMKVTDSKMTGLSLFEDDYGREQQLPKELSDLPVADIAMVISPDTANVAQSSNLCNVKAESKTTTESSGVSGFVEIGVKSKWGSSKQPFPEQVIQINTLEVDRSVSPVEDKLAKKLNKDLVSMEPPSLPKSPFTSIEFQSDIQESVSLSNVEPTISTSEPFESISGYGSETGFLPDANESSVTDTKRIVADIVAQFFAETEARAAAAKELEQANEKPKIVPVQSIWTPDDVSQESVKTLPSVQESDVEKVTEEILEDVFSRDIPKNKIFELEPKKEQIADILESSAQPVAVDVPRQKETTDIISRSSEHKEIEKVKLEESRDLINEEKLPHEATRQTLSPVEKILPEEKVVVTGEKPENESLVPMTVEKKFEFEEKITEKSFDEKDYAAMEAASVATIIPDVPETASPEIPKLTEFVPSAPSSAEMEISSPVKGLIKTPIPDVTKMPPALTYMGLFQTADQTAPQIKLIEESTPQTPKGSVSLPTPSPTVTPSTRDTVSDDVPLRLDVGEKTEKELKPSAPPEVEVRENIQNSIPVIEDINAALIRSMTGKDTPMYKMPNVTTAPRDLLRQSSLDASSTLPGTASLVKIVHRKICISQTVIPIWDGNVKPFTESQLKALYYNRELEVNQTFIDHFVEEYRAPFQHELYELLMGYFRARNNLQVSSKDIQALHQEYTQSKEYLWITTEHTITNKSHCEDGKLVTGSYQYQRAKYSEASSNKISRLLKQIREQVYSHLSLYAYTAQMARLQVESYLHKVIMSSPDLKDIPHNSPVQGYSNYQLAPSVICQVDNLKQCISILFSFQRKPIKDKPFVQDTRTWLTRLIAVLLRVATFDDHLFLLNHVLRCPSGVSDWATAFVQPPPPKFTADSDTFGNVNLDHAVTTLATLLLPVKAREEFLKHVKSAVMTASYLEDDDSMWVLIDSDGEEDEDPSNFWFQWRENDLVALLNQIPMEDVFRYMLRIDRRDDHDIYDPSQMNEQVMMKIFAFATQLVQIFKDGLKTFNLVRYRQLAKRISRFIRHIVQYVSDHWQNYQIVHGTTETTLFTRLQIEFDQFFLRATYCIFSSQKLGSWQFMAGLPYTCVSTAMLWQIIRLLHGDYQEDRNFDSVVPVDWQGELQDSNVKLQFEENLTALPECEAYYLLTSFANMACSRDNTARELVEHIAMEIYDIAFVSNHTREICSKGGRELLTLVATKHPFILSRMVHRVKDTMTQVGMVSLYLFRELPFHLWQPSTEDLGVISDWLLCSQLTSPPNLLARLVLAAMNWGFGMNGEMYLCQQLHNKVALMVAEAYCKLIPAKAGLLAESFKQVSNIASIVCQTPTPSQAFCTWAWDLMIQLRVHLFNQPTIVIQEALTNQAEAFRTVPSLQRDNLQLICNGIRDKQPAAAYLALSLTTIGHSIAEFERNLNLVNTLMDCHQYRSVIHVLSLVTPLYYTSNSSINSCKLIPPIIQNILMCDMTYLKMAKSLVLPEFPGKYLRLFVAMILNSAKTANEIHCSASDVFLMWLEIICNLNQWSRDRNALYVVDSICRAAFPVPEYLVAIKRFLSEHYKNLASSMRHQNPMSSFLWWVTTTTPSSLVNRQSCPEFPWFTFCALDVEAEVEEESRLWRTVALEMLTNARSTPDMALKKASSVLRIPATSINQLAIYHWAHQAIDTAVDHPLTHLFWQRFFGLYLQRWTIPGQPDRGSVGSKFFESMSNLSTLKRMKKRLHELVDYHQKQSRDSAKIGRREDGLSDVLDRTDSEPGIHPKSKFHADLALLYGTLVLWIEEPKLHDSTLYLPSLPPQYDSCRLSQLQQNDKTPWLEFMDLELIQHEHDKLIQEWTNIINPKQRFFPNSINESRKESARDHILKRLRSYEQPKPPPVIVPYKVPVPEVSEEIFENESTVMDAIKDQFKYLTDFAKIFSQQMHQHVVLDTAYLELMPELYKNTDSETTVIVACKQGTTGLLRTTETKCAGPAQITMKYRSKKVMDSIQTRIEQNRREHQELLNDMLCPPPQNVCGAAVFIENVLMSLIKRADQDRVDESKCKYQQIGVSMFYYIHQLIVAETNNYPPSRQFLTSSIEILGQEFINNNPEQCQTLLRVILNNPQSVGLLAPHFNPSAASKENFIHLYKGLITVARMHSPDLAFVLLSKFDVNFWLSSRRPKLSERQQILQLIGEVLLVMGVKPSMSLQPISDIYRNHLQALLLYQFPDHYGDFLQLLFKGSESQSLCPEVWYDLLNGLLMDTKTMPFPVSTPSELRDVCQRFAHNQIMFMTQQLKETLELLNSHFLQRRQSNKHAATYGLYQKYTMYVPAIRNILTLISHGYILSMKRDCDRAGNFEEVAVGELWLTICKAYSPWLQPFQLGARLSMPWVSGDVEAASGMAIAFGDSLKYLHQLANYSPTLLGMYLEYYANTCRLQGPTSYILSACYNQIFSQFEWPKFHVSARPMKNLMEILDSNSEDCLHFLSKIFLQLPWPTIVDTWLAEDTTLAIATQICDFTTLIVRLAFEPHMVQMPNQLATVLKSTELFPWYYVDLPHYNTLIRSFLSSCRPSCIFGCTEQDANDVAVMNCLAVIAGFVNWQTQLHPDTRQKRCSYVKMFGQLLSTWTNQNKHLLKTNSDGMVKIIVKLLEDMEGVITANTISVSVFDESVPVLTEMTTLLNTVAVAALQDVIIHAILSWGAAHPRSPLLPPCLFAICRGLASVIHMCSLSEALIASHFRADVVEFKTSDAGWSVISAALQIPELTEADFLNECLKQNNVLTLYGTVLQRQPQCSTANAQISLLAKIVDWVIKIKPTEEAESKMFLLWNKAIELSINQGLNEGDVRAVCSLLITMCQNLLVMAEDKTSVGFLGSIGFGKRSSYSVRYRLAARATAAFILSHISANNTLRLKTAENTPSSEMRQRLLVREPSAVTLAPVALAQLESCKGNKLYQNHQDQVIFLIGFLSNQLQCLQDYQHLMSYLSSSLFPEKNYLLVLKRMEQINLGYECPAIF